MKNDENSTIKKSEVRVGTAQRSPQYEKTIIYKLFSKNADKFYIGHTTTTVKSIYLIHKYLYKTRKSQIYKYIAQHGGIKEWEIETIENYPCENITEARERKKYFIKELNATLNSYVPNRSASDWRKDNKERYYNYLRNYYKENKARNVAPFLRVPHFFINLFILFF